MLLQRLAAVTHDDQTLRSSRPRGSPTSRRHGRCKLLPIAYSAMGDGSAARPAQPQPPLPLALSMVCSGLGPAAATIVSNPLDVCKTRLQFSGEHGSHRLYSEFLVYRGPTNAYVDRVYQIADLLHYMGVCSRSR